MKSIKSLFSRNSPSKSRICHQCKKEFKGCGDNAETEYCTVICMRKSDWDNIARIHAEQLRRHKPSPPRDLDYVIKQALESASSRSSSSGSSPTSSYPPSYRTRTQSSVPVRSARDAAGQPHPLARKRSNSEHLRSRAMFSRSYKSPPPVPPKASSAGNTPGHVSRKLPREIDTSRARSASMGHKARTPYVQQRSYFSDSSDSSSEVDSPTSWGSSPLRGSPFPTPGSAPLPHYLSQDPYWTPCPPPPPPHKDARALTSIGRHNKSASDLVQNPRLPLPHTPPTDILPASVVTHAPMGRPNGNALGLTVTPFLIRKPSHPPTYSRARPPQRACTTNPTQPSLPRSGESMSRLRPGYEQRRAPRPRSNSFGGFQYAPVRAR